MCYTHNLLEGSKFTGTSKVERERKCHTLESAKVSVVDVARSHVIGVVFATANMHTCAIISLPTRTPCSSLNACTGTQNLCSTVNPRFVDV